MNRYISKSYTKSKNTIDRQYKIYRTEAAVVSTITSVNITGYRFISSNRVGGLGGGAGLYLRDTFNFNVMSDLCSSNSALFDSVFVEIENPHGKNFIIGTFYRI